MHEGRIWPPEWNEYTDHKTGVKILQLTNYKCHSHHLYFTNSGWYDNSRRLLFSSDRENRTNLFSIDLKTGEITQLTDLDPLKPPYEVEFLNACVSQIRNIACFWYGRQLTALNLKTLEKYVLWEMPKGFLGDMLNFTADGKYVCAGIFEDLSYRFKVDYLHGYIGFRETWEARPLSRIMRVSVDSCEAEVVWEERMWIGHVNTSPTQPNLITFCHEGPWDKVDNRIWGLDLETRRVWMIRPREGNESVGHEYWLSDGVHIGYHGSLPDGNKIIGMIRYDNKNKLEFKTLHETGHTHSNDFSLIAGDGGRFIRLWKWDGSLFEGPRVLCEHRSSFHIQHVHPHPRFSPDGRQVLYTSDAKGYGNIYLASLPKFEDLPRIEEIK